MKKHIILFTALSLLVLLGCEKAEIDLRDSVMIYDDDCPGLPIYSEYGYNTFGAYFDRGEFISNWSDVPGKILVQDGNTSFILTGYLRNPERKKISVSFTFLNMEFDKYEDLLSLDNLSFDLSDTTSCRVTVEKNEEEGEGGEDLYVEKASRFITFKKAQRLIVDKEMVEIILAGEFELQVIMNDKPSKFTDGRFDIGVGKYNFFRFD